MGNDFSQKAMMVCRECGHEMEPVVDDYGQVKEHKCRNQDCGRKVVEWGK